MTVSRHVVSIVFNKVEGDSRVIKTAQAALGEGWDATIVGVTNGTQREELVVEGVRVVRLPNFSSTLKKRGLWGQERDLRLLIGGQAQATVAEVIALRPDLIHSHDMIGLKLGASATKALRAGGECVPWVHDLHEFVAGLKGELAEVYMPTCLAWEREFLHQTDALITVSDALAQRTATRYRVAEPEVVYNAPNAGNFVDDGEDLRSHIGLAADVPLVVFVGGATPLRGCPTIVEGVSKCEGVHLAFLSQGPYVEEMRALAAAFGMSDRFHTHPYVASDRVSTFIRTADLGIHGLVHYPNAEVALPNKLFEYLHARLPVVVSDVESMKAFVERYGVGECFEAEDASSCAAAVLKVLGNRGRYKSAISPSLLGTYSWEAQARKLQSIYGRLLSQPQTVTPNERQNAIMWEKAETTLFESAYSRALAERVHTGATAIPSLAGGPRASLRQAWRRLNRLFSKR